MRKRRIGSLEVTVVGVGCNNFGRSIGVSGTREIMCAALDHGITFFDTADRYGVPTTNSETVMGEVIGSLGARRNEMVLATKFGRTLDAQRKGAKPAYVKSATEASLRRLRTDRIDLMQLHIPDPTTPIEDTLGALADLVKEGKIREIGASNFSAAQLREAASAAVSRGIPRFMSTQAEYSLLDRRPEIELLPECEKLNVALLPYYPLYNGLLTGKYRPGEPPPPGSRMASKNAQRQAEYLTEHNMNIVADLIHYAESRGHTLLELAIGWLLSHTAIPSVIAGVSSPSQVASNVSSANWQLTADEVADIERIAPLNH